MTPQSEILTRHAGVVRASDWCERFPFHRRPVPEGFRRYRRVDIERIPHPYYERACKIIEKYPHTRLLIAPERAYPTPHPSAILPWDGHR